MPRLPSLLRALAAPVDAASLVFFRVAFGLLMAASVVRFAARGWIDALYVRPALHFHYWGLEWVHPPPPALLHAIFAALALLGLSIAAGLAYRASVAAFFVLFTYVELIDKATYLNHYYFLSALSLLMIALPLGRPGPSQVPRWALAALRLQVGLVYFFAGLAKLRPDWLLRGEPLHTWLAARADLPLLGPLVTLPGAHLAMSWAGAAFDLSLPFLLLARRTRPWAYAAALVFHVVTAALFPRIGMFPWIMICAALVFFPPAWPRELAARLSLRTPLPPPAAPPRPLAPALAAALALHFTVQLALPLRRFAYPGDTAWTEEGYRYAWQVMLVEKVGAASFRVRDPLTGRERRDDPEARLTRQQAEQMAFQPDMILEYAHWLAAENPGHAVYADVYVTYNGRPSARLIDPAVDLAREREGLAPKPWILPLPAP